MTNRGPVPDPSIEYSLLGLLADHPMHGYELFRELSRKTGLGLIWTVKQAQLYAVLAKLETEGLISAEVVVQGSRPARRVFHLTEAGRSAFSGWLREPASRKEFRLDFLAKLCFALRAGPSAAESLVAEQRRLCALWLEEMRSRGEASEARSLDSLVYRYRVGQLEAMSAWLEECADYVGAGVPQCP